MIDFLDLPGWTTTARHRDGNEMIIEAVYAPEPEACAKCGTVGLIQRWGVKERKIRDAPVRNFPMMIKIMRRRYKCRSCGGTFFQPLPDVEGNRRMTIRCRKYIEDQSVVEKFTHIAAQIGCDEKTVRQIAMAWKLDGKLRTVLTDLDQRTRYAWSG